MKVVVAGGSGLIGRHLVRALLADDDEVIVLSRSPAAARCRLPRGTTVVGWDPTGRDLTWAIQLASSPAVVNLCGESIASWPWSPALLRRLRDSRLGPTNALVDAIASLPIGDRPSALVNASSTELYDGSDTQAATEGTPPTPSRLGRLVLDWEAAARAAEDLSVRVVLLRTALVIAARAPALERLAIPVRFAGGRIGSGRQWVSWVAIDDVVQLVRWAIRSWDVCGALNVASPAPVKQREFAAALGRALGRPARVPMPAWAVRLALGEQATLVLGSRRVWPAKALAASYVFRQPDLDAALKSALV